jgi:hypothetical protein
MDARAVIAANPFFAEVLGEPQIERLARWAPWRRRRATT